MTKQGPRFINGVYRDCQFCHGRGCLACAGEADREYNRQFPGGPKPVAVISSDDPDLERKIAGAIEQALGTPEDPLTFDESDKGILRAARLTIFFDDLPE
jgi:hypothetical protein